MNWKNVKNPVLWGCAVYYLYLLSWVTIGLVFNLLINQNRLLFILLFVLVAVGIVFGVALLWRPLPPNHNGLRTLPLGLGLFSLFQIFLGSISMKFLLVDFLPTFSKLPPDMPLRPYMLYLNVNSAVMLPIGVVVLYFSLLQLLKNRLLK